MTREARLRWPLALFDLVVVELFVVIGRSAHGHGEQVRGIVSTSWPFVVGLVVGWLLLAARGSTGRSPRDGGLVTLSTVVAGMVLRVIAGQGTAFAFVVVALGFLGAIFVGGRLAFATLSRRRGS